MRKSYIIQLLCTLIVAVSGALPVLAADTYRLDGRVVSAETGEPLDMALIKLNTMDWASTDADGKFHFPKLVPGIYQ